MKLYSFVPQDCSGKVRWLLNEMEIEFEDIRISYKNGDAKKKDYLEKQPLGQVPVLEDGELTLFESYAIVTYLADKEGSLAPSLDNYMDRGKYYQWLFFSVDSAEKFFEKYFYLSKAREDYKQEWGDYIHDKVGKVMGAINAELEGKDYILGKFSAVDTCLGCAIDRVSEENFFSDYPNVKAYYERLKQRPACIKSEVFKK